MPIKLLLAGFLSVAIAGLPVRAAIPDIKEISPDGKWLFKASWHENRGYTWELQNKKTSKVYFLHPHAEANEVFPARLNVLWSPDCRYLAINLYYGRIGYDFDVIAISTGVPFEADWPRLEEASMIKLQDRKMWDGSGVANSSAESWQAHDTLVVDIDMRSELDDKATGKKFRIDSSKKQAIQFTGLKGKVVENRIPQYDKQPAL